MDDYEMLFSAEKSCKSRATGIRGRFIPIGIPSVFVGCDKKSIIRRRDVVPTCHTSNYHKTLQMRSPAVIATRRHSRRIQDYKFCVRPNDTSLLEPRTRLYSWFPRRKNTGFKVIRPGQIRSSSDGLTRCAVLTNTVVPARPRSGKKYRRLRKTLIVVIT